MKRSDRIECNEPLLFAWDQPVVFPTIVVDGNAHPELVLIKCQRCNRLVGRVVYFYLTRTLHGIVGEAETKTGRAYATPELARNITPERAF